MVGLRRPLLLRLELVLTLVIGISIVTSWGFAISSELEWVSGWNPSLEKPLRWALERSDILEWCEVRREGEKPNQGR